MSLKNAVLFSVLTAVCCQIQIPISSQDLNPIFRDFNPGLTDFSPPRLNLGEEPELPDVADSLCLAKIKGLYNGLATFNQESIACEYSQFLIQDFYLEFRPSLNET